MFTLDELSTENLRSFFRAGDVTANDAIPAEASVWVTITAYALGDWVEATGTPVITNGKLQYYIGNWVDITERKQVEENIRKAEDS